MTSSSSSTMQPATTRFFSIAELMTHLLQYLDYPGISRLMITNRHLNEICTPTLYYNVNAQFKPAKHNIFGSAEATKAFARNTHHVRQLNLGLCEVAYYANCIFAFQDLPVEQQSTIVTGEHSSFSRPLWLTPPDPHTCTVLPIPPMTMLTKLNIDFENSLSYDCPYLLPSRLDSRVIMTYICWIISSNPRLTDVSVCGFDVEDQRDIRLLAAAIFGMKELQNLNLSFTQQGRPKETTGRASTAIFFSCPPSLRTFHIHVMVKYGVWNSMKTDLECGLPLTPQRLEPLTQLTSLTLWRLYDEELSELHLRSILEHCPNLGSININSTGHLRNVQQLAKEIAQLCPKLTTLIHQSMLADDDTPELMLRILESLPEQQVERFNFSIFPPSQNPDLPDTGSLIRRHSSSLRFLTLDGAQDIDSRVVQIALTECGALEQLDVHSTTRSNQHQLCIKLEDAVLLPWACTRIQDLILTVAIPDQPLHRLADGAVPYYSRPLPATFSVEEKHQLGQLETLYRQIGALTELRQLDLRAIFFDPSGDRLTSSTYSDNSFPALLNLPNQSTGQPGYLHHLAGLTKLERIVGSVSVVTAETRVTVGMDEAVWMERHWPALRNAQFCPRGAELPEPFQWLKEHRDKKGQKMCLAVLP
ncbi:MAG: hypothetical protein J3R72DRAFT_454457 [Linnemannia gamsii]|nr:MAG: hypothetical protein J3R72DRAFT_454457 [Linnemannia gamsii]